MTIPAAPAGRSPVRSRWLAVAKLLATVFFLYLVFRKVDVGALLPLLAESRWEWLGACIGIQLLVAALNAVRWKMLWPRPDLPLSKYLYFVFLGQFFSMFVPSAALSEAMRVLAFGRKYGQTQETIGVNLMARGMGAISQILVAGGLALWHFSEWKNLEMPGDWRLNTKSLAVGLAGLSAIGFLTVYFRRRWTRLRFAQAFIGILKNQRLFTKAFTLSIALQFIAILGTWTLFKSQTDAAQYWHMAVFGLASQLILLLPLSIGGLGLREYLNLVMYGDLAGLPADTVLAVSVLGYVPLIVSALVGGLWMGFRHWQGVRHG